jgi:hypothetical protein
MVKNHFDRDWQFALRPGEKAEAKCLTSRIKEGT